MTFDKWMKAQNSAYKKTDDSVFLRTLRNAWIAATKAEREACAKVCDDRAKRPFVDEGFITEEEWDSMARANELCADAIRAHSDE